MIRKSMLCFFILFQFGARAGETDTIANHVFSLIYQQDLPAAEHYLEIEKYKLSDFYYLFLNLDLHWWKYRTSNSKSDARALEKLIDDQNRLKTVSDQEKMKRLLVKSYQLRYEKKKLNLIGMLSTRSDIQNLINQLKPDQLPVTTNELKLFESYVIMYEYIENINFWGFQNNSGERQKKLHRMEEFAADENLMLNTVARFFLARMYQKVEKEPETGLKHFKILTAKYPTNATFAAYQKECESKL